MRRLIAPTAAGVVLVAAVAWGLLSLPGSSSVDTAVETGDSTASTTTVEVSVGTLTDRRQLDAEVSHGENWSLMTSATGTVTSSHAVGTVIDFGDELVRIDDKPLFLAKGEMPMYRELALPSSDREGGDSDNNDSDGSDNNDSDGDDSDGDDNSGKALEGQDVTQLQRFLLDQGFDDRGRLKADGIYGPITARAVKAWQESVGLDKTGKVGSGQLVFAPWPVRIALENRVGASFDSLSVTLAEATVVADVSSRDVRVLPVGAPVTVTVGDRELDGKVVSQESETIDGSTTWKVTITVDDALPEEASAVTVNATEVLAENVKILPVSALLALAEGGYGVELASAVGPGKLIRVEVGEIFEGRAEVISDELSEGDEVVIPT